MTEEAIIASGGLPAIAALQASPGAHRGAGRHGRGVDPGRAALPKATRHELILQAQLGLGRGTGRPDVDGDGVPGTSAPDAPKPAMGAPNQKPSEADRNPLGRTAASAAGDVERLVRASVGVDDFVDVKCADYKWRKGHIVAVHEGKPPEEPRSRVLRCEVVCPTGSTSEPKTLVTELSLAVGSGRVARLGTFSDTWIHDYSAVSSRRSVPHEPPFCPCLHCQQPSSVLSVLPNRAGPNRGLQRRLLEQLGGSLLPVEARRGARGHAGRSARPLPQLAQP